MADLPPDPESNGDTGTPRWVKVFGIIALALVLLFVILHLTGRPWWSHAAFQRQRTGRPTTMTMTPGVRKFALTAHVTSSVGWFGAVAGFLALAVAGLTSQDARTVRAACLAIDLTAWSVIAPLSLVSLLTGLVQSLGTPWGLFRHYWVLIKSLITIFATIVLLLHMQPIGHLARVVAERTSSSGDLAGLRIQLVANASAALLALLVAMTLAVYKPRGMTPYGRRKQREQRTVSQP